MRIDFQGKKDFTIYAKGKPPRGKSIMSYLIEGNLTDPYLSLCQLTENIMFF